MRTKLQYLISHSIILEYIIMKGEKVKFINTILVMLGLFPVIDPNRVINCWDVDTIDYRTISTSNKTKLESVTWKDIKNQIKRIGVFIPDELIFSDAPMVLVLMTTNNKTSARIYTEAEFESLYSSIPTRSVAERVTWISETVSQLKSELAEDVETLEALKAERDRIAKILEEIKKGLEELK